MFIYQVVIFGLGVSLGFVLSKNYYKKITFHCIEKSIDETRREFIEKLNKVKCDLGEENLSSDCACEEFEKL